MKPKKILITGAGGFVGKNLTEYLTPFYTVYPMTHRTLDLLNEEAVADFFANHEVDIVLHCAVMGGSRLTNYDAGRNDVVEKNIRMFLNLRRPLPASAFLIHFGSGAEYDKRNYRPKMTEDYFDTHVPADAYGFAKYTIAKLIEGMDRVACFRIFGLFGRYEDYRFKFISNAIVKNLLHLPIVINQNVVFDYLYIKDFLRIIHHFIENQPRRKFYNITPTMSIDLRSAAGIINEVSDFASEISIINEGLNTEYTGDNQAIRSEIGNFNFTPYDQAIDDLYQYYRAVFPELDIDTVRKDPFLARCLVHEPKK